MSRLMFAAAAAFLAASVPLAAQAAADDPVKVSPAATEPLQPADPPAPVNSADNPMPKDYSVPASQAYTLLPTDAGVVTNGPVPDTPANRAKDGQPLSRAGRAGQAAGN